VFFVPFVVLGIVAMDWKVKYVDEGEKLAKAFRRAAYVALKILGFDIRATAKSSIEDEKGPSTPGSPPHTHKRYTTKSGRQGKQGLLPASILYGLEKESLSVLVGPSVNLVGTVGAAFEHEGNVQFRGHDYPPRPFMVPALQQDIGELPGLLSEQYGKIT
jgi:hypothetical protein